MKNVIAFCIGVGLLGVAVAISSQVLAYDESSQTEVAAREAAAKPKLETLLSAQLEGVDNTDVIVSRVSIPPNTSLPKHWHPGEEFVYILEGSVSLWLDGELQSSVSQGDIVKVSLKQVHTAITRDEGVTALVFRVHERGKPERVIVD